MALSPFSIFNILLSVAVASICHTAVSTSANASSFVPAETTGTNVYVRKQTCVQTDQRKQTCQLERSACKINNSETRLLVSRQAINFDGRSWHAIKIPKSLRSESCAKTGFMAADFLRFSGKTRNPKRPDTNFPSGKDLARHRRDTSRPHTMGITIDGIKGKLHAPLRQCRYSGIYKWREKYFHPGQDLSAKSGAAILAIYPGVVVESTSHCRDNFTKRGWRDPRRCRGDRGFGNRLMIMHKTNGKIWYSGYHHLGEVHKKTGDRVARGEKIGTLGSTGVSFGPHLHFEIIDSRHVRNNPARFYSQTGMCF